MLAYKETFFLIFFYKHTKKPENEEIEPPYYRRAVGAYTPHAVLVREQR